MSAVLWADRPRLGESSIRVSPRNAHLGSITPKPLFSRYARCGQSLGEPKRNSSRHSASLSAATVQGQAGELWVVVNWFEELRQRP